MASRSKVTPRQIRMEAAQVTLTVENQASERTPAELPKIYAGADLYLWPAINEAFGMMERQEGIRTVVSFS